MNDLPTFWPLSPNRFPVSTAPRRTLSAPVCILVPSLLMFEPMLLPTWTVERERKAEKEGRMKTTSGIGKFYVTRTKRGANQNFGVLVRVKDMYGVGGAYLFYIVAYIGTKLMDRTPHSLTAGGTTIPP